MLKKAKRSFIKKTLYECRKAVANSRTRVKGRFANKKDAENILKGAKAEEEGGSPPPRDLLPSYNKYA